MPFALTTHWNSYRHASGEALVEEILSLGFKHIELGYDLTVDLVEGIRRMVEQGAVSVTSVHNYCPVPMGVPQGHPELFLLSGKTPRERNSAVMHIGNTIEFAASMQAKCVVLHGGRVSMTSVSRKLMTLAEAGEQNTLKYEKLKQKLLMKRDRKVRKQLDHVYAGLEELMPVLERHRMPIALENLPSWEAIPSEMEMEAIGKHFDSPLIGYWHDTGHGQIRQNLGFVGCLRWLERLQPYLRGFHIHDVIPPTQDHAMPPKGHLDFAALKPYANPELPLVFEPAPGTPEDDLRDAFQVVKETWAS